MNRTLPWNVFASMLQNLRYALRRLIAEPGFTLVVVLAIGLGIGMNTTVFTLVNAVLLRGLPYENPEDIVVVAAYDNLRSDDGPASWPDYEDWARDAKSFKALAAMASQPFNLSGDPGAPERIQGMRLTPNAFRTLGQPMMLGRDFVEADGKPGAAPVTILGYEVWERRFAGDRAVVGKSVRINEIPTEIVGVLPRGVKFPQNSDAYSPINLKEDRTRRGSRGVEVFGRLNAGVGVAEAQTELGGIAARLEQAYPETNKNMGVQVMTFNARQNGGPIRVVFLMLLLAVSLLLLIACANVASLLIARAVSRTREMGVRIALGAARGTIIRQLLTESIVLGCLGGLLGLGFAYVGVTLFDRATADVGKPYWIVFSFDWKVFGWLALACVGTGLIFGLAPALQLARTDTNEVLKDASRGATTGRGRWLTSSLVVMEMAFTLALLSGAGVMIRSFMSLYGADLGARTENVLTARLNLMEAKYPDGPSRRRFVEQLDERLRALPGVEHVSVATTLPGDGLGTLTLDLEGQPRATKEQPREARVGTVTPGFFQTFGINATQGRLIDERDGAPGSEAVVVDQIFAQRHYGRENPVGRRIMLRADDKDTVWASIVGVVPHVRHGDLTSNDLDAIVYRPWRMSTASGFVVALRSRQPVETLSASLRGAVQGLDPDQPVFQVRTMEENLARQRWPFRVFGTLFVLFAIFGLVLSTIGMYAVTAHSVGQRRNEIGLRMALGAQQSQVAWLVLRRGLIQLASGIPLGLAFAYGVMVAMESLLIGIKPGDPLTMAVIMLIVTIVTLAACYIPARRAARLNPVTALRN
ncbi:MAG: ABC transporter permease [Acidobacteriota bacterium]|nr:ABC transporter permease [Acidobacteriota bacterium]